MSVPMVAPFPSPFVSYPYSSPYMNAGINAGTGLLNTILPMYTAHQVGKVYNPQASGLARAGQVLAPQWSAAINTYKAIDNKQWYHPLGVALFPEYFTASQLLNSQPGKAGIWEKLFAYGAPTYYNAMKASKLPQKTAKLDFKA